MSNTGGGQTLPLSELLSPEGILPRNSATHAWGITLQVSAP